MTQLYLRFLDDKRQELERIAIAQWKAGTLSLQADQTIRGQIIELEEVIDTPFEQIVEFYQGAEGEGPEGEINEEADEGKAD